eukprot:364852-Chlamydomonas_euryale.AAC.8
MLRETCMRVHVMHEVFKQTCSVKLAATLPCVWLATFLSQCKDFLKRSKQFVLQAAACGDRASMQQVSDCDLHGKHQVQNPAPPNSHAQPFCSSMVSARSDVVLIAASRPRLRSLRTSLASMLMLATSFTMHAIFSVLFSSTWRSSVVLPALSHTKRTSAAPAATFVIQQGRVDPTTKLLSLTHPTTHLHRGTRSAWSLEFSPWCPIRQSSFTRVEFARALHGRLNTSRCMLASIAASHSDAPRDTAACPPPGPARHRGCAHDLIRAPCFAVPGGRTRAVGPVFRRRKEYSARVMGLPLFCRACNIVQFDDHIKARIQPQACGQIEIRLVASVQNPGGTASASAGQRG